MGKLELYDILTISRIFLFVILISCLFSNTIQILQDYVFHFHIYKTPGSLYDIFCNYAHVFLGISVFYSLRFVINHSIIGKMAKRQFPSKLLGFSDEYSYNIYLVHQVFILGTFSFFQIKLNFLITIVLIFVTIICFAIGVKKLSHSINKLIDMMSLTDRVLCTRRK